MDYWTIFAAQMTDPFRIALLVGLLLTMRNTQATTGTVIPALAGIVFVAALIPMTMAREAPFWPQLLVGLASNAVILGVLLGVRAVAGRLMR